LTSRWHPEGSFGVRATARRTAAPRASARGTFGLCSVCRHRVERHRQAPEAPAGAGRRFDGGPGTVHYEHPRERKRRRPDGSQPECAASCRAVMGQLRKGGARASARTPELAAPRTRNPPGTAPRNARLRPGATGGRDEGDARTSVRASRVWSVDESAPRAVNPNARLRPGWTDDRGKGGARTSVRALEFTTRARASGSGQLDRAASAVSGQGRRGRTARELRLVRPELAGFRQSSRSRLELACRRGRLRVIATEVRFPPDAWCQGS